MSLPAVVIFLTMIALMFVGCDKQLNVLPTNAGAAAADSSCCLAPVVWLHALGLRRASIIPA